MRPPFVRVTVVLEQPLEILVDEDTLQEGYGGDILKCIKDTYEHTIEMIDNMASILDYKTGGFSGVTAEVVR